ncbi:Acyl transferase domain-containing protein [Roseivivax marinus]|uniref:type I polyketide synthase n=1 Tax=Roseivivax marinus TaxID=1379903 RepID=UPI0008C3699C|nr:type I polyketide synthase [Roseivivax marinus]SEK20422.1 Acyl transferase domain-containing protein [Roseivivax marinus]
MTAPENHASVSDTDIAIVGLAAHLPGSDGIAAYWRALRDGVCAIRPLSEEDLRAAGEDPARMRQRNYVAAAAMLDGFEMFDADAFGLSQKDAAIMDPQHRRFLETAWEAFDNAGHAPETFEGRIGVFAGCGEGTYYHQNLRSHRDLVDETGLFLLRHTGNDKDFLTTRLSHVMNLTGPSVNVQTACSTSLVAAHYGVQALLNGECDMALAGGVTIELPQGRGYLHKENEILSPDGACHAFDHRAQGTVFGSGAGVVVLRRLADAIADGDHIWAVIKGSAVNNDGAAKAGYLAPSVDGQAQAVAEALAVADVDAGSIGYVECHGTGTYLGDPIEVAALTQAFRRTTDAVGRCRIGSVKTNIGHLDTAAGVAGLIKTSLALHHRQIPPSLGYEAPNPAIDFANSPFRVADRLTEWPSDGPRRAGVNALGVGGTNAHLVLEEAPERAPSDESAFPFQVLTLSGRSKAALDANADRLAAHLRADATQPLADVAFTLKDGRRPLERRRVVVAESHAEAARLLSGGDAARVHDHRALSDPDVAFLFPGGGAQYPGMARDLYETEPVFAEWMDRGLDHLATLTGTDPRDDLFPEDDSAAAEVRMRRPSVQLPLIAIVEVALAELWQSWGVVPAALAGHSMGENAAACVAGVMGFEDMIGLVHLRGTLFNRLPGGGMLSVPLSAAALRPLLGDDLDLAAENAPGLSVASGPSGALDRLEAELAAEGIECRRIVIDIAAHSRTLEPILGEFREHLQTIRLSAPRIPLASNRTGTWMTDAQATSPDYWVEHLRHAVRFAECVGTLARPDRVFLEVGPGRALASLARQHPEVDGQAVVSSLRHPDEAIADDRHHLEVVGRLWALGVEADWAQVWGEGRRNRVVLPGYAFQRQPYYIAPAEPEAAPATLPARIDDVARWGWVPAWRPRTAPVEIDVEHGLHEAEPETWLFFVDGCGVAEAAARRLRAVGHDVVEVRAGDVFARTAPGRYTLAPERARDELERLFRDLSARGTRPDRIAHYWLVTGDEGHRPGSSFYHRVQEQGFETLLALGQVLAEDAPSGALPLTVFTNGAVRVRNEALPHPAKATIAGPARVIPREVPGVRVAVLDLDLPVAPRRRPRDLPVRDVLEELLAAPGDRWAALRGGRRYEQAMKPRALPEAPLPEASCVLLTGGFGGIGLTLARALAARGARIALVARGEVPERSGWDHWLRTHAPQDRVSRRISAIRALEAAGAEVMWLSADVCNEADMRAARTAVEARFGPVDGVIHGAGVIADAPLLSKTPAQVEEVFTPKIHGTDVLARVFPDGDVTWMALFASSSTVTAPAGQVDYVAANAYLNAWAEARAGGRTRVVALNWGIWSEVGMAAEAVAARTGSATDTLPEPVAAPLLDTARFDRDGRRVIETRIAATDWIADEHRLRTGEALLPGTGTLTLMVHALAAQGVETPVELRDVTFLRPVTIPESGARDLRVRLTGSGAGHRIELLADADAGGRAGHVLCAQGTAAPGPHAAPIPLDLASIRGRLRPSKDTAPGNTLTIEQEAHLAFGPRWRVLTSRALGEGEGLAELALPAAARGDAGFVLHPGLLDIATGWAMELVADYRPSHLWAPLSYDRITIHAPLPARLVSWVRLSGGDSAHEGATRFDVTLAAPDGAVAVEIEGFELRRLADPQSLARPTPPTPAEIEVEATPGDAPLSPAEERLVQALDQGIRPQEGADAFARAMALGVPQVVVSSMDMGALTRATAEAARPEAQGHTFERPTLDSDYAAPETEVEKALAGMWAELLGVAKMGVDDDFFDLGGHSLIAVRLFSQVRRAFRVDFPISVLFEAPTIRACAALIEGRRGATGTGPAATSEPARPAREPRFMHLVAMHEGSGGPKAPLFVVSGMFGNVLNLRHLAHLVGQDRPFWGLQARGLFGDAAPHRTIPEAARDYIAEIKQVCPDGPYLIGGFSGGGITAFEIARQLEAAGDRVALVALLDTPLPQRRPLLARDRALIQLHELRRRGLTYPLTWARNRVAWEIAKRRAPVRTAEETRFHDAEIEAAFLEAAAAYEVQPWDGRLALFRPPLKGHWKVSGGRWVDSQRAYLFHDNDWGRFVPCVEVHEVPGDHDSMVLEPNVRVLARTLGRAIARAEAEERDAAGRVVPFRRLEAAE